MYIRFQSKQYCKTVHIYIYIALVRFRIMRALYTRIPIVTKSSHQISSRYIIRKKNIILLIKKKKNFNL